MNAEELTEELKKANEERERLRAWLRLAIQTMDRHVPIDQYPAELDTARDYLGG